MARTLKVAITGSRGQLGRALSDVLSPDNVIIPIARPDVDICNWFSVRDAIARSRPHVVIHTAAATDVDGCERDPDMAFAVNAHGTRNVAQAAAAVGSSLVYVSTNYVFDGSKVGPYHEWDAPSPLSVYGTSKLAGELEARIATPQSFIVRTAMLYDRSGHNFVRTMLRLMRERDTLRVVSDQWGNPTYAADLAVAIKALIDKGPFGTYHLVNRGIASWHDWATEIRSMTNAECTLIPIPAAEYQRAARPPANGAMQSISADSMGIELPDWRDALYRCLTT